MVETTGEKRVGPSDPRAQRPPRLWSLSKFPRAADKGLEGSLEILGLEKQSPFTEGETEAQRCSDERTPIRAQCFPCT